LNTDRVVAEAAKMADEVAPSGLTLAGLAARLGVRQPSLYKDVASLDFLQHCITTRAKGELADVLGRAAIRRARDDAVGAVAHAYRAQTHEHPGVYQAAQRPRVPGDIDDEAASQLAVGVLEAVISGYGLRADAARSLHDHHLSPTGPGAFPPVRVSSSVRPASAPRRVASSLPKASVGTQVAATGR
jgi:hypothetical protein